LSREALNVNLLASLLSLSLENLVVLNTLNELLAAVRLLDVLNAEVDTLGDDAATNTLVDGNTNSATSDVPDDTGLTVVELVGHTLVACTITLDIDDITDLVDGLEAAKGNSAGLTEILSEKVTGTCTVTERVGHIEKLCKWKKRTKIETL